MEEAMVYYNLQYQTFTFTKLLQPRTTKPVLLARCITAGGWIGSIFCDIQVNFIELLTSETLICVLEQFVVCSWWADQEALTLFSFSYRAQPYVTWYGVSSKEYAPCRRLRVFCCFLKTTFKLFRELICSPQEYISSVKLPKNKGVYLST